MQNGTAEIRAGAEAQEQKRETPVLPLIVPQHDA